MLGEKKKRRSLTAIFFVALVCAFRRPRAVKMPRNAAFVLALKLIRSARNVFAIGKVLVGSVRAIFVSVANPRLMDASYAVLAFEFPGQTTAYRLGVFRTVLYRKRKTR